MIDEYILVPQGWRRALTAARVALAIACLVIEFFPAVPSSLLIRLLLVVFLAYSVLAFSWRNRRQAAYGLLSLVLDSVFFLICAGIGSGYAAWLCGFFFLYLLAAATLLHSWRQVLGVTLALPPLFCLVRPADAARLLPAFALAGALALIWSRQKHLLVERLLSASRQAVLFRSESEKARQAERERIAADFHDGPQQSFISLQMRLEVLRRLLEQDPEAARRELAELQELTRAQVAEIRSFVRAMRPIEVDGAGLAAALSRLVDTFEKDSRISAAFLGSGQVQVEDPDVARELVQIVREALHNTQKHSGASRVAVGLEKANGQIEITVQDDGSGFEFAGKYSLEELDLLRLGPESIKRRVRSLGGDLTLESRPGFGAGLKIRIPL